MVADRDGLSFERAADDRRSYGPRRKASVLGDRRAALGDLDTAVKQISQVRGQTGAHMAVLDSAKAAHTALATQIQTAISDNVEIDAVSAASQLAKASQALKVSQAVTSHVLQLLNPTK